MAPTAPLSKSKMVAVSMIGLAVEFTWASGESVIIPYLLSIGVSTAVAGLAFLSNPLVTLPVGPCLGRMSDNCTSRCGRRRPFIVGLTMVGMVGLALLIAPSFACEHSCVPAGNGTHGGNGTHANRTHWDGTHENGGMARNAWNAGNIGSVGNAGNSSAPGAAFCPTATQSGLPSGFSWLVVFAFLGFGVSDVSHDCLLGPGRSMIMDLASAEQADTANAMFTGMQMVGRFLALSLGSVPLEAVLGYDCAGTAAGDVIHMQAIMGLSAGLLFLCSLCVSEVPHRPHRASQGGLEGGNARLLEDPVNTGLGDVPRISDAEGGRGGGASAAGGGAKDEGVDGVEIPSLKTMAGVRQHSGMPTLLAVQLVGWMALMAQCFYWTEWIGDYQVRLALPVKGESDGCVCVCVCVC